MWSIHAFAGWLGMILLLTAYGRSLRMRSSDLTFHLLNAGGAAGIAFSSWFNGAWPATVLNCIWLVIGMVGILQSFIRS